MVILLDWEPTVNHDLDKHKGVCDQRIVGVIVGMLVHACQEFAQTLPSLLNGVGICHQAFVHIQEDDKLVDALVFHAGCAQAFWQGGDAAEGLGNFIAVVGARCFRANVAEDAVAVRGGIAEFFAGQQAVEIIGHGFTADAIGAEFVQGDEPPEGDQFEKHPQRKVGVVFTDEIGAIGVVAIAGELAQEHLTLLCVEAGDKITHDGVAVFVVVVEQAQEFQLGGVLNTQRQLQHQEPQRAVQLCKVHQIGEFQPHILADFCAAGMFLIVFAIGGQFEIIIAILQICSRRGLVRDVEADAFGFEMGDLFIQGEFWFVWWHGAVSSPAVV